VAASPTDTVACRQFVGIISAAGGELIAAASSISRSSDALAERKRSADLRRAARLFAEFRVEQTEPDRFYGALAADSVAQLSWFTPLAGKILLDVGGGPGYFADAFRAAGARYVTVDPDVGELSTRAAPGPGTVLGSGTALPIRSACVDVCYSSNVLEHVGQPERMADEMLRVTRPGGTIFLSYTVWLSPWGGHETSPWHYLGGRYAATRFRRRTGRSPKNDYGRTLFSLSAARMLRWAAAQDRGVLVAAFPRYHPWWLWWLLRVPLLRELLTWNLVLVLRRR
jgi:SAM-dependent methyltransferase